MIINPITLSIITTHQCTAACDHCCFSCTPKVTRHIPVANIHRYIDQATEVPSIRVVVFTGGECFLLGKDLDELVRRAAGYDFCTRFVSNGYWATSPRAAAQRIDRLVQAGLKEANFSTGEVHGEYVDPAYVRYGAIAAAKAGLVTVVTVEVFREMGFDLEAFIADPEFQKLAEERKIIVKCSPWMSFSGERKLSYAPRFVELVTNSNRACSSSLSVVSINPDEHLISCCGLTLEDIEELHLGDLRKQTIREILETTPNDFIKFWIHVEGPAAVIEYAMRFDDSIKMPDSMAHICDVCRYMYHEPKIADCVRAHPPTNISDIITRYFAGLLLSSVSTSAPGSFEQSLAQLRRSCSPQAAQELVTLVTE